MRALISILVDDDDDDDPGYCDIHLMAAVAPQMLQLTSVLELARAATVDKVHTNITRESGYILIRNHRCSVADLTTAGAWKISVCCGGFRVCNNP